MSLSDNSLLKQEGEGKQIIGVNAQKHKAFQRQLPRTAWYSWQLGRGIVGVFYSWKWKTKDELKQMYKSSAAKSAHNL